MRDAYLLPIATTLLLAAPALSQNTTSTKQKICPILGQQFPLPTNLSCAPAFLNATHSLTHEIDGLLDSHGFNTTTFSIGMFSTEDASDLIYEYHHTHSSVAKSKFGTKEADADSIYRVGSVSKLFTVYLFLLTVGEKGLNVPIAECLPELRNVGVSEEDVDAVLPKWEEITVGELMSQLGGLTRDYARMSKESFAEMYGPQVPNEFPGIPEDEVPTCGDTIGLELNGCSNAEYINGVARQQAALAAGYSPTYSNIGYNLAGAAMERAINTSFSTAFDKNIVHPLGLQGTSAKTPNSTTNGIIPGNTTSSGWDSDFEAIGPSGGHFSSTRDLAKIGKAIMDSELLSEGATRRWLKPQSFVESFEQGVGMPWEIFRVKVDGYTVDMYTKDGDFAIYHSKILMIPQFGFGISILSATDSPENLSLAVRDNLGNILTARVLSAIAQVAKSQAHAAYAGHYTALPQLNSSLTLTTDTSPGLKIESWISNGTDFLSTFVKPYLGNSYRLTPNLLYPKRGGKVGFLAQFPLVGIEDPTVGALNPSDGDVGSWYWNCKGWSAIGAAQWGDVGVEQWVFEREDVGGEVKSAYSKGLRVRMVKVK